MLAPLYSSWSVRKTVLATLIAVGLLTLALGLIWLRSVLLLLFAGMVVATALGPICTFIAQKTPLSLTQAAALVYLSLVAVSVGLAVGATPTLLAQSQAIVEQVPTWYESGREALLSSSSKLIRLSAGWLPATLPSLPNQQPGARAIEVSQHVLAALAGVVVIGMLAFYWTISEERTIDALLRIAPDHRREYYDELIAVLLSKLGAYIRGQLILCTIVFVLSLAAYFALGLPYALVLALVAGLLEAIPVIGPTLGAVPAVIVALSLGPQATIGVIVAAVVIQLLENYVLVPKVMDQSVGIGAVVTLLAIVAFGALFGFLGAVLAIPLAAIVQTLFERLVWQRDFKDQEFKAPRDNVGVVHYQLQDLIQDVRRQQRQKEVTVNELTVTAFDEIERLAVALDDLVAKERQEEETRPVTVARGV